METAGTDRELREVHGAALEPDAVPTLRDVLETVAEFGEASAGLVAWDLCVSEIELGPVWDQAVGEQLIEPVRRCAETGETLYRLIELRTRPNN
ncbi:MAG: hypothetical protein ACJ76X_02265 [Solirubrobacteraceae bacterium]